MPCVEMPQPREETNGTGYRLMVAAHAVGAAHHDRPIVPGARYPKLFAFPPPANPGPALFSLLGIQGIIELVGGILIAIGLFTRPVAFVLAGNMAVAYFMRHAPRDFFPSLNGGKL